MGFQRILLKLSGEALIGDIHQLSLENVIQMGTLIQDMKSKNTQLAIVIGGGNILRGLNHKSLGLKRDVADNVGMLATCMNGLFIKEALSQIGLGARVFAPWAVIDGIEAYGRDAVDAALKNHTLVIFVAGTGHPYFSTDTAAALRAIQIGASLLIKVTKVDGVYDKDPASCTDAKKYDQITYTQVLDQKLRILDLSAVSLCQENRLPIFVTHQKFLKNALESQTQGTLITGD